MSTRFGIASLALTLSISAAVRAQPEIEHCEHANGVRVCGDVSLAEQIPALVEMIAVERGSRVEPIAIEIDAWRDDAIELRIHMADTERPLRIVLSDVPRDDEVARMRTIALAIAAELDDEVLATVSTPEPWRDERRLASAEDRDHYFGWFDASSYLVRAEPGLSALSVRARVLPTLDRVGVALATEISFEHLVDDVLSLGVEVGPAWFAIGDRISGGLAGGLATFHLVFDGDFIAFGLFGGMAAIPRSGSEFAGVFGLRTRIGLYDFIHADFRVALGYADVLGVFFGQVRGELLLPADAHVEILCASFDVALDLGWAGVEAGVRIWPSGRRSDGDFGVEVALGGRFHVFAPRCEFGGCAAEWGAGGPTLAIGLLSRMR